MGDVKQQCCCGSTDVTMHTSNEQYNKVPRCDDEQITVPTDYWVCGTCNGEYICPELSKRNTARIKDARGAR